MLSSIWKLKSIQKSLLLWKAKRDSTHLTLGPEPTTSNVQIGKKINQDVQSKTGPSKIENAITSEKGTVKSYHFFFLNLKTYLKFDFIFLHY